MSAPVDVLAVLEWAAEQVIAKAACASDANRFGTAASLREARAAVAELIAADREYDTTRNALLAVRVTDGRAYTAAIEAVDNAKARRTSALARVQP